MPMEQIQQPEVIEIRAGLRLKKYDGHYEKALAGYQDPYVYQNSEGIFDESRKPNLEYVKNMCEYLNKVGELYFIEVLQDGEFVAVGDVTVKAENPPIAIWTDKYRGAGIGAAVMKTVIGRLKELGFEKVTGTTVYKWNEASQKLHEKLGFRRVNETEKEYIYELELR